MLGPLNVFLFSNVLFFINCEISNLSVRKLDRKLVSRKRQDTVEMCRIFTTENNKLEQAHLDEDYDSPQHRRVKRKVETLKMGAPVLSVESVKRIENIVDKLYEDVEEKGQKVSYRTRNPETLTTAKDFINKTMRRFNFAPAILEGPLPTHESLKYDPDDTAPPVPWHKKWVHGIVPYFIDSKTYDSHLADVIIKAFDYFERATCIRLQRLRDRPTDRESLQNVEWLYITNPSGIRQCVHSNERKPNKGVQMVVFGYDCMTLGEIVHEVMHVLGFSHEHTRPDRDSYITILWNNIKPGYKKYFEMRTEDQLLNVPYDYSSVLHYPPRAFSKNGQITIMAQNGVKLGQREGLSESDVEKVGLIFGHDCIKRNKQYLLKTCPSVVKSNTLSLNISQSEITDYFKPRLWPYGIINYMFKDKMEFTIEERDNVKAVIEHIEKETCIQFKDLSSEYEKDEKDAEDNAKEEEVTTTNGPIKDDAEKEEEETTASSPIKDDSENEIKVSDDDTAKGDTKDAIIESSLRKGLTPNQMKKPKSNLVKTTKPVPIKKPGKVVKKSTRRHAGNILILSRSVEPGCTCPTPGKPDGNKMLKINADCFNSVNDLLHIFVHVLGLDHQHNTHDRDSYLHILWDNLTPEIKEEMKTKLPPAASVGFGYDYQSVMHYPWLQIKNGITNIMYPIWNDGWAMGHWQGLSSIDVQKINLLYFEQCLERTKHEASEN